MKRWMCMNGWMNELFYTRFILLTLPYMVVMWHVTYLWLYMVYANNSWNWYGDNIPLPYLVYASNSWNWYGDNIPITIYSNTCYVYVYWWTKWNVIKHQSIKQLVILRYQYLLVCVTIYDIKENMTYSHVTIEKKTNSNLCYHTHKCNVLFVTHVNCLI